jgi:signal peptidase I
MDAIPVSKNILLYYTSGGSMFPFIRWRECLIVKKTSSEALQPGDIVVFREDRERPVCHRIVRIENKFGRRWFYTKGDQNDEEDAPVPDEKIIGKVIAIRKKYRLIECSSPEWSSYSNRHDHLLARSIFSLKTRMKKVVAFMSARWRKRV